MSDHADPDPAEPWRYACRACGSVAVDANRFCNGMHGSGESVYPYRCNVCNHGDTHVRDRRTDDPADPRNLAAGGAVPEGGGI